VGSGTPARALLLLLVGCAACITQSTQAMPLYSPSDAVGAAQAVLLSGYIARVDNRDVSALGDLFEVLPGCHIVTTPTRWGTETSASGMVAFTGPVTFALQMTAGHRYAVIVDTGSFGKPSFTVSVRMDETTRAGDLVRSIGPVKGSGQVEACRRGS
jgi:hypothetical protein